MLKDFRKHDLQANDLFQIVFNGQNFFCKVMAEEVFVFYFNHHGVFAKKIRTLKELENFAKKHGVLFQKIQIGEMNETRDFGTIKLLFNQTFKD